MEHNTDITELAFYKNPIVKFLYLISKYGTMLPELESIIDHLIIRLLLALGYENDMLVIQPKLCLQLHWGNRKTKSIVDYTITDILSSDYKICIMKDIYLNDASERYESVPQLYAHAIAMNHKNNENIKNKERKKKEEDEHIRKKRASGEEINHIPISTTTSFSTDTITVNHTTTTTTTTTPTPILGIRVNGTRFYFYSITIPDCIETAMIDRIPPSGENQSCMYVVGEASGYDIMQRRDRNVIITILDLIYTHTCKSVTSNTITATSITSSSTTMFK